ncbi:hypothetical protein JOF53_001302 [Crossiella equi]|uniref:NACHT domain-containing protein n=1 Tax=Crossiella equi TaxID=130796 RepID=A0ABS5A775_9PSEU|nr:hypothetical protein [Crossiella equi]MBP2472430.1 hypothetical protein [Crossiella equi]
MAGTHNHMGGDAHVVIQARDISGPITVSTASDALPLAIAALDHSAVLATADGFTGREWLLDRLAAYDSGYALVAAGAGMGKTTLAAHLVREWGCAHHFTQRVTRGGEPVVALRSLAAQLVRAHGLTEFAPGGLLQPWAADPAYFPHVLAAAAAKGPVRLVVDGLDESAGEGLALGLPHPEELPPGVLVVATCRDGFDPARLPAGERVHRVRIDAAAEENREDVRRHLLRHDVPPEFVETLAERSGGVWIYLRYVLARRDPWTREALADLPEGLTAYYRAQVTGRRAHPDFHTRDLPLLATLAAAQQPVSVAHLSRASGQDAGLVTVLCEGRYRAFLTADGARYAILHASLREFLTTEHPDAVHAAHHRLADDCLTGDPTREDHYALRHLPHHLATANRLADLHTLLTAPVEGGLFDTAWADHHDRAGSLETYLSGLALARQHTDDLVRQTEYALLAGTVTSAADALHPELLADLVEAGLWDRRRALSHARRCHRPRRRADALTALLPAPGVAEEVLAGLDHLDDEDQAWVLHRLVPHLDQEQLERAAHLAAALTDGPKGEVIAEVALRLTGAARERAYELLLAHLRESHQVALLARPLDPAPLLAELLTDELPDRVRARGLTELAPRLDPEQLETALRAAELLAHPAHRAEALGGLGRHLGRPLAEPGAYALHRPLDRAFLLSGQAAHLSGEERDEVLTALLSGVPDDDHSSARITGRVGWLVPHLDRAQLDRIVAAGLHLRDELLDFVSYLDGDQIDGVLAGIRKTYEDSPYFGVVVASLPAGLVDRLRHLLTEQDVRDHPAALLTPDWLPRLAGSEDTRVLTHLARLATGAQRTELLTRAVHFSRPYGTPAEAGALAGLAARLGEAEVEIALRAVADVESPRERAEALRPLAGHRAARALARRCTTELLAIENLEPDELVVLAPLLDADQLCQAIDPARARIVGSLAPLAERVLALAPWLTGAALPQARDTVRHLAKYTESLWLNVVLAPHLPRPDLEAALARGTFRTVLRPVATYLLLRALSPEEAEAFLPEALRAANAHHEVLPRLRATAALAVHLPEPARTENLAALVEEVARLSEYEPDRQLERLLPGIRPEDGVLPTPNVSVELLRARLLRELVPHLDGQLRADTLDTAVEATLAMAAASDWRAYDECEALPLLAPLLEARHLPRALAVALEVRHTDAGAACRAVLARIGELPGQDIRAALNRFYAVHPPRDLVLSVLGEVAGSVAAEQVFRMVKPRWTHS